ncbi:MAG: PQQ-dependent sugar dehydrogenase [Kangiellaceae bacterium]|nr:PQQ-dependent sugar dehydrogenase [Kangiellaceae bacterium]
MNSLPKVLALSSSILTAIFTANLSAEIKLEQLILPKGFKIDFYATDVENARQLALSTSGIVYAGSRRAGNVYALKDSDKDGKADKKWIIAEGLNLPSGIAWKDGNLYVAEVDKILVFKNIDNQLDKPKSEVLFSGLPSDRHHGWKYIDFSPQGDLIIPVGAPCNVCEAPTELHARILSLDIKTKKLTELAQGVRNTVGFDFHPTTGELWFSDNGRDMMGDDIPACEINRITQKGQHFGFPYVHAGEVKDPEFGKQANINDYVKPELNLGAHVAPLGIHFYQGKMLPTQYHNQLLVAEHGSWNRSKKSGYKVAVATINKESKVTGYQDLITGFMKDETTFGRPVSIIEMPDGSLLISDDYAHVIYRVSYSS